MNQWRPWRRPYMLVDGELRGADTADTADSTESRRVLLRQNPGWENAKFTMECAHGLLCVAELRAIGPRRRRVFKRPLSARTFSLFGGIVLYAHPPRRAGRRRTPPPWRILWGGEGGASSTARLRGSVRALQICWFQTHRNKCNGQSLVKTKGCDSGPAHREFYRVPVGACSANSLWGIIKNAVNSDGNGARFALCRRR